MFEAHKQSGSVHLEARFRRKDGTLFPVEINAHHVFFEGRAYSCASFRDITHRKRREKELQQALMELEKLKNRLQ